MTDGEACSREDYRRVLAHCDAARRREDIRDLNILFVLFSWMTLQALAMHNEYLRGLCGLSGGWNGMDPIHTWQAYSVQSGLASFPLLVALLYGVQRARAVSLPPDLAAALSPRQAHAITVSAIRRALYLTVLPQVALPLLVCSLGDAGLRAHYIIQGQLPGLTQYSLTWLAVCAALSLLMCIGTLMCVLEWQVLLVSRFPARNNLLWLQFTPYLLPFAMSALALIGWKPASVAFDVPGADSSGMWLWLWLTTAAGLALAPWLWRWAAAARNSWRWAWLVLLILGLQYINVYFAHPVGQPLSVPGQLAQHLWRGLYLGSQVPPLFTSTMLERAPALTAAGAMAASTTATGGLPGMTLAGGMFLPWYLALVLVALYYAFSCYVLRRCADMLPASA